MKKYYQKDGRAFIVQKGIDNKWHSKSYARYILEQTGKLNKNEDVHHIDGDKTNDNFDNLQKIDIKIHRKYHSTKYYDSKEICSICGKEFLVTAKQHGNRKRERNRGKNINNLWFCSRHCIGVYGKQKQLSLKQK